LREETALADLPPPILAADARGDWVRLRTLILLRWLAVAGQSAAILIAWHWVGLRFDLGLAFLAIGAAAVSNMVAMFVYPESRRLSEREAMLTLMFDISQLAFLLFLTGGLNNPFALLMLAPVTISASALRLGSTVMLGVLALALISLLALVHVPLRSAEGALLALPPLFLSGFWAALVIGILFIAAYSRRVTGEMHAMSQALLATQMALAREQKLTDLGGVVAAAAHELGTPLATIKLVSTELLDELSDRPDLAEDARLIRAEADRCRDILRSMGRAGKDDLHLRHAPLSAVVREAAEPHAGRGRTLHYDFAPPGAGPGAREPEIWRRPEIIHGLRNLVQNAVDFAQSSVWIDASWTEARILVRVVDDGAGYPPDVLGRIGDPFVRRRRSAEERARRPEYEGMGLGLFIAKTLLERSGAELSFANAADPFLEAAERPPRSGAIVEVIWPRAAIALSDAEVSAPLGQNQPFGL
jgi:two-component system sensor histidine kinase RegB